MRSSIPVNNFAFGQIDRELKARFDLPIYQNGAEIMRNFFSTVQGNAVYRAGFEMIEELENSYLIEFKFNVNQSYLLVLTPMVIKFYGYDEKGDFVRVLGKDGNPLELAHTWGDDRFNLKYDQCGDVMYFVCPTQDNKKLTRTAANVFTLATYTVTQGASDKKLGKAKAVKFYENRLNYISNYTRLFGSLGGNYDNLTVGANKNDGYSFDLAELKTEALWLYAGQSSLVVGSADGVMAVNGGSNNSAITPTDIKAKLSTTEGASKFDPIEKDGYVLYSSSNQRNIFAFAYDIMTEAYKVINLNKANFEITKGCVKRLAYKKDRYNLIWGVCGDNLIAITFHAEENVNGFHVHTSKGKCTDICTATKPNGEYDLFAMFERDGKFYLERLSDYVEFSRFEDFCTGNKQADEIAYNRKIAEEFKKCNYLDCSKVYNGLRTSKITFSDNKIISDADDFNESDIGRRISYKTKTGREYGQFLIKEFISPKEIIVKTLFEPTQNTYDEWYLSASEIYGLEHLEGQTVSVVANGGYIGEYKVIDGKIDISESNIKWADVAIVGLSYEGIIKSFNLGFSFQATNTQTTPKSIYKAVIRFIFSAGGLFGSSMYDLVPIQKFSPDGLFDSIPLPMDKDEEIIYNSGFDAEKHFYIVQREPLPLQVGMVVPHFKQSTAN